MGGRVQHTKGVGGGGPPEVKKKRDVLTEPCNKSVNKNWVGVKRHQNNWTWRAKCHGPR